MITDILVIGSGISGLCYAIKIGEQKPNLKLNIISKNNLLESNIYMHKVELSLYQISKKTHSISTLRTL